MIKSSKIKEDNLEESPATELICRVTFSVELVIWINESFKEKLNGILIESLALRKPTYLSSTVVLFTQLNTKNKSEK